MIIVHRCKTCGHNDLEARDGACGIQVAGLPPCCTKCDWGRSVVIPTWTDKGDLVKEIHPPGMRLYQNIIPCSCDECKNLYEKEAA